MLPNIGLGELTVIVLIALLVFGPKRLPEMMRTAGRAIGKFQREAQGAMQELRDATNVVGDLGAAPDLGAFDAPDPQPQAPVSAAPMPEPPPAAEPPSTRAAGRAKAPRAGTARKGATAKGRTEAGSKGRARTGSKGRAHATAAKKTPKRRPAAGSKGGGAAPPAVTEPFEDT